LIDILIVVLRQVSNITGQSSAADKIATQTMLLR